MPDETTPNPPKLVDPNDKLKELLAKFEPTYCYKVHEWTRCLEIVAQDLGHVLAQGRVQHIPIASRVKAWKSIVGTAARRQRDQLDEKEVRRLMGARMGHLEEHILGGGGTITGSGHFQTPGELERIFHDMLGARIILYFPNDKKKVLDLLHEAGYEKAAGKEAKRMGGLDDVKRLRRIHKALLKSKGSDDKKLKDHLNLDGIEKQFSGYAALHLVFKVPQRLQPRDLGAHDAKIWDETNIEIQVGTVIMHAWSEVEHDITYKTRDRDVTQDEKGLLDILNGLAIASEVGLRSFHSPQDDWPFVTALKDLRSWMHQLYIQKKESVPAAWLDMEFVWEVVIKSEKNCRDLFMPLAKSAWETLVSLEETTSSRLDHLLPYVIVDKLCEGEGQKVLNIGVEGGVPGIPPVVKKAHNLAVQLVSSLNLAQRLRHRPEQDGSHYQSHMLRRHYQDVLASPPSLAANTAVLDIFDILHPQYQRCSRGRAESLIHYCETLLDSAPSIDDIKATLAGMSREPGDEKLLDKAEDKLTTRVLIRLARSGFTAWPILANPDEPSRPHVSNMMTIPGAIPGILLADPALQFNNVADRDSNFNSFVDEEKLQRDLPTLSADLRQFLDKYTRHLVPVEEPHLHGQGIGKWKVDTRARPPKAQRNQCWEIMGRKDFPQPPNTLITNDTSLPDEVAHWPTGFALTAGLFRRLRLEYRNGRPPAGTPADEKRWWRLLRPPHDLLLAAEPAFDPPPQVSRSTGSVVRLLIDKGTYGRLVDEREKTVLLETVSSEGSNSRQRSAGRLVLYSDTTADAGS